MPGMTLDVLALGEALERLARASECQAQVVELRFFGGLSVDEIAGLLELHRDTVRKDWRLARAWLNRELTRGESS